MDRMPGWVKYVGILIVVNILLYVFKAPFFIW